MLKRFGLGFGIGYILGARGGEKRYAQLASAGQRLAEAPVVRDLVERAPDVARDTFDRVVGAVRERASFTSSPEEPSSDEDTADGTRPPEDRAAEEEDEEQDEEPVTDEQGDEEPESDEQGDDDGPDTDDRAAGSAPTATRRRGGDRSAQDRGGRPGRKAQPEDQPTEGGNDVSEESERPRRRSLVSSVAEFASAAAERGRVA